MRVLTTIRRLEYAELVALFFLQGAALGMWFIPLSSVLDAHGLSQIKSYAFATSAVAAFVSPLLFGAMADRHVSPVVVLRWLAVFTALTMSLAATAIRLGWGSLLVLALIQLYALCSAPTWSIANTIVFSRLRDSQRQFGPVRAMATFGWMSGGVFVSVLGADASARAAYVAAAVWLILVGYTFLLPAVAPPKSGENLTLRQRMGWDALGLLKNRDHRVVFITAALFTIPVAALYPFTPPHLRELGMRHISAWMALAQVSEVVAMFALGGLLMRWRLKWIFAMGLGFGLVRYLLCALDDKVWLLVGIALHGSAFTLVFITAQIYLNERIDPQWRARAQALMSLMTGGFGNLFGYLGTGWWFAVCTQESRTRWSLFWGGLAAAVALVMTCFLIAYRGIGGGLKSASEKERGECP